MTRASLVLVLTLMVASCGGPGTKHASSPASPGATVAATAPTHPYLVVSKRAAQSIRVIDLATEHGRDLAVGATTLGVSSDGHEAFVTAPDAGELVVISGWPPVARIVHGLRTPHDAAAIGPRVAVTEEGANDLAIVDPVRGVVSAHVALPGRPHNVVAFGSDFLVTMPNRKSFAVVTPSGEVRETPVGERPHACQPFASSVWCVTYDAPHLLEVRGGSIVRHVTLGVYPHHLAAFGGSLYVSDVNGGTVYLMDATGAVTARVADPTAGHVLVRGDELDAVSETGFVYRYRGTQPIGRWSEPGQPHGIALVG